MVFTADDEKLVIDIDPHVTGSYQDPKREDRYEKIVIGGKGPILFRYWESQNDRISDLIHDQSKPWIEEGGQLPDDVIARGDKLRVKGSEGETGLRLDHGLIVRYHGTPTRKVAIINGEIVDDDTAAMREELLDKEYPRFVEWGFRVEYVILTDGPRERERLSEAQEQKRNRAEQKMFDSQREFFDNLMTRLAPGEAPLTMAEAVTSPEDLFKRLPTDPTERKNFLNLIASELEDEFDEEVDTELVASMADFSAVSPVEEAIAQKKTAAKKVAKKATRKAKK